MVLPIEIFRAGRHTDMRGETVEFGEPEIDQVVQGYDVHLHEAPIVIGHPAHDAPAYGWVKALSRKGEVLNADADQVDPAFAELLKSGAYKKRSASFYRPTSPNNPKPGSWYLRHVGFLGAQPPAVKGLREVELSDADDALTVEFGDWGDRVAARLFRGLRDWMIEKFGTEEADKVLPPWEVDSVQEEAAKEDSASAYADNQQLPKKESPPASSASSASGGNVSPTEPSPPPSTEGSGSTDARFAERERSLQERERQLQERELEQRRASHVAFLESIVAQGRPLPCKSDTIVSLMRVLDGESSVSFGEAEARPPLELFKQELLARLPKTVELGELGAGDPGDGDLDQDDPVAFAEAIVAEQKSHAERGVHITTSQAAVLVQKRREQS